MNEQNITYTNLYDLIDIINYDFLFMYCFTFLQDAFSFLKKNFKCSILIYLHPQDSSYIYLIILNLYMICVYDIFFTSIDFGYTNVQYGKYIE